MDADIFSTSMSIERSDLPVLPTDWRWVQFSDVCDRVSVGHVGPTTEFFTDAPDGIRLLRSQNVRPGKLELENALSVTPSFHKKLKKSQLQAGDILFVRVGANRGDCCVVPNGVGELNCANIVFARPKVPTGFHAYFFQSNMGRNFLLSASVGAAQGVINTSSVSSMPVPLPPLPIQRRIAGILSAYDDLIENNQRRIAILETMARSLYREWFVHYRYPGHEAVPLVDSPLGPIPQGWEVRKLGEVADINQSQISNRNHPEELHYIDISSVSPGQINNLTTYRYDEAPGRARRIVQHGDVLWSCVRPNRRSYAQVMYPESNTIASTGFAVLTATKVPYTFLYFTTTTDDFVAYLTNNATGSAYPAVTATTFENAQLIIPPESLLDIFGKATRPMSEQIHILQRQTQNLRRTRDLLLPRLLSGQIDVGDVE